MKMKRIISLALMALLLCLPVWAMAEMVTIDGINYALSGDTALVAQYTNGSKYSGDVVIPATIEVNGTTYPVSKIVGQAFWYCTDLASVSIPNSVTGIGNNAFCNCTKITSILIPNSVTNIGNFAFMNCSNLTSVTIPDSVTNIGTDVFKNCAGLQTVNVPCSWRNKPLYTFIDGVKLFFSPCKRGEWTVVRPATTMEAGMEQRVCTACGHVLETREIPMLPAPPIENPTNLPKTGDDSNVILWSALACISVIGMMTLVRKRKEA